MSGAPIGLAALEARLRQDLEWLDLPPRNWVPPREVDGRPVRDVVIIGAGMCGLAAAAALLNLGIRNTVAYDRAPAGLEGPWITFARMRTLAIAEAAHRTGARPARPDLPRLVRGAVRPRRLGRAGPDPPPAMDAVP